MTLGIHVGLLPLRATPSCLHWQRFRGVQFQESHSIYISAQKSFQNKGHISNKGSPFLNLCFQQGKTGNENKSAKYEIRLDNIQNTGYTCSTPTERKKEYILTDPASTCIDYHTSSTNPVIAPVEQRLMNIYRNP